jgi:RNA polymerase sigma-70 factor, ECF subfamily
MHEITELLKAWNDGDTEPLDKLIPLVEQELKKIARNYMSDERPGHILQPTALVHEALLKIIRENISWQNRKQFYGFMKKRMRQVLIDCAKKQLAVKRGKRPERVDLKEAEDQTYEKSKEIIALEEALEKLARIDERQAAVVECRFFIGLTFPEIAKLLGVATKTVERDWKFARAWLKREMIGENDA